MKSTLKNPVTVVPAAPSSVVIESLEIRFRLETDCWDVHATQELPDRGFVLLDVRSRSLFEKGHLPGATHFPHRQIDEHSMAEYPEQTLFVVYCSGPHCNGARRAALRLAKLGRPVKEMAGGIEGWRDEGFELAIPTKSDTAETSS